MIDIELDVMLARRKKKSADLATEIGITPQNLSLLKNNRVKAVRLNTLNKICFSLDCQVSDILVYKTDDE